ncbi:glycosyltransferase [Sphingobacterium puteale]|uniref:glycosyltransferase n=1 Tax=Sphingobacterium puteale TaxID=2420510 RepID=UPI003D987931
MEFSVLLSVYHKESPLLMKDALNSIIDQTLQPSEIVIVKDGPLTQDLDEMLLTFTDKYKDKFKIVGLDKNLGLGNALKIGLENCKYELVARMDTDDIARPYRFKMQVEFLSQNLDIDVLGGNMEEFNEIPGDLKRFKINPELHEDLIKGIYYKNPFNHPTVMYRRSKVIKSGSYNDEYLLFEDYALFLKMWKNGMRFHNLQEILVDFRVGSGIETIKRRSGLHYLKKEKKFLNYARELGVFGPFDVLKYKILKFPIRMLPPRIVLFIYNKFLRK